MTYNLAATSPYMHLGEWYEQKFSDEEMYFLALADQKNGGMSGILVTVNLLSPRAKARHKKSSVWKNHRWVKPSPGALWRWIAPDNLPDKVKAIIHELK